MDIESFTSPPLQKVIPSYLYQSYADDEDLQAFVNSQNAIAQGYLDWFNQTPLGLYTAPNINNGLLDWVGMGVYGIPRPVLASGSSFTLAGYNTAAYNTIPLDGFSYTSTGTASLANDDIYKRVLTWNLYRGDGQVFTLQWLKNRIARFLYGSNGSDYPVLNLPPSITVSGTTFTIASFADPYFLAMQQCIANDALALPFMYDFVFVTISFVNDGGVLQMTLPWDYPTSPAGLLPGAVWFNGGTVAVVPGVTPNPSAPPVYFSTITVPGLLALGGGDLPLSDPANSGQLWNNGGMICVSP
jgi:hypothetical protein